MTDPFIRAVEFATTGTGGAVAELPVTMPAVAEVGDTAISVWQGVSSGLITGAAIPDEWLSVFNPQAFNSNTQSFGVARKTVAPGDAGNPFSFGTLSASRRQNLSVVVIAGGFFDSATAFTASLVATFTPPVLEQIPNRPGCLLLSFALPQHPAANVDLITGTEAADWDEILDFGTSVGLVNNASQFIQSRQLTGSSSDASTYAASHSVQYGVFGVAFSPPSAIRSRGSSYPLLRRIRETY